MALSPTNIHWPFSPAHFHRLPLLALLYQSTRVSLIFINVASSRYTAITISHFADLCRHYRRCAKDGKEPDRPDFQPSAQGFTCLFVSDNSTRHSEAQVCSRPLFIAFSARQAIESAVEFSPEKSTVGLAHSALYTGGTEHRTLSYRWHCGAGLPRSLLQSRIAASAPHQ